MRYASTKQEQDVKLQSDLSNKSCYTSFYFSQIKTSNCVSVDFACAAVILFQFV